MTLSKPPIPPAWERSEWAPTPPRGPRGAYAGGAEVGSRCRPDASRRSSGEHSAGERPGPAASGSFNGSPQSSTSGNEGVASTLFSETGGARSDEHTVCVEGLPSIVVGSVALVRKQPGSIGMERMIETWRRTWIAYVFAQAGRTSFHAPNVALNGGKQRNR